MMSAKTKEDSMKKHTYFSNRNGYLEHRYDCPQCKREQFPTTKEKLMWFVALLIVFIVVSGKVSLWNFQ